MTRQVICCTSTPRSSAASCARAIASPAIRATRVDGAGWEFLFVAIDDHARIGFTDMHPDEKQAQRRSQFLRDAVAYYASWASGSSACSPTTARRSAPRPSPRPVASWASQAQLHPTLPAADQRQGRALHPVGAARMGLRLHLPPFTRAHRRCSTAGCITTTGIARIKASAASHRSSRLSSVRKQPLDASHLAAVRRRGDGEAAAALAPDDLAVGVDGAPAHQGAHRLALELASGVRAPADQAETSSSRTS